MSVSDTLFVKSKMFRGSILGVVLLASSVSFVITLTEFVDSKQQSLYLERLFVNPAKLTSVSEGDIKRIEGQLSAVKDELVSMKISAITVPVSIDVTRVEQKIDDVASRLALLESAISNNPERALAVPMLRKDHEALVKQFNDSVVSSKLDYDRLWGMLMLLLTSLGAAVVVLSGWALKSVFSKGDTQVTGNAPSR
ncbi:hypothetical protein ACQKMW_18550 [Pseudomonas sivasensis]|uniref:hypothetical protein n=1 Tax=Pseudomonas sivasensis TaxID=1880678 RepID=UPI003D07E137